MSGALVNYDMSSIVVQTIRAFSCDKQINQYFKTTDKNSRALTNVIYDTLCALHIVIL